MCYTLVKAKQIDDLRSIINLALAFTSASFNTLTAQAVNIERVTRC